MKSRILTLFVILNLAVLPKLFSQNVSINSTGNLPDTSAMLDVSSTTKGFLLPRMTTVQQNAIILPATGLAIFNVTLNSFEVNTGTPASPVWSALTTSQTITDTTNISNFSQKVRSLLSGTAPIIYSNGLISISQATTSSNGYLSSTDWNTFNNKADTLNTWSTTGNSGTTAATNFIGTR